MTAPWPTTIQVTTHLTTLTIRLTTAAATRVTTTNFPDPLFAHGRSEPGAADAYLAELYEQHGRTVLGLCRMLLRDPSEAEDAAQQTFLSAYRNLLAGSRPRHPAAWLATIARNECWNRIQERMRRPIAEPVAEEVAATTPGPLELAIRNADLAALLAAIGELPKQQRDALLMREFSGLSYGQLAQALAVSEPAVESLLVRARRELRLRLQPIYAACLVPFVFLRDLSSRLGEGGESSLGAAAKLGSLPLAAKLAAGAATIGLVGSAVVGADRELVGAGSAETPPPAAVRSARVVDSGIVNTQRRPAATLQSVAVTKPQENDGQGSVAIASSGGDDGRGDGKGGGPRSGGDPGSGSDDPPASTPTGGRHGPTSGDDGSGDEGSSSGPGSTGAAPGAGADPGSAPESPGDGTAAGPTDPAADDSEPRSVDDAAPDDSEAKPSDDDPSKAPEPDDA
jgi:RNA polymerase sigma-70 factor (ECF subfamily)